MFNPIENQKILEVYLKNNVTIINIKADCTIEEYSKYIDQYTLVKDIHIPVRQFIRCAPTTSTPILKEQKLYIINHNNYDYFISISKDEVKISERKIVENNIHETVIELNNSYEDYKITKYIHNSNLSTKTCKWYPSRNSVFLLEKNEALSLSKSLLDNLYYMDINKILNTPDYYGYRILDIYNLYDRLNLINDEEYYPVISDNIMTLSWPHRFGHTDINKQRYENLDIILNDSREKVGIISFNYYSNDDFNYDGNVSYEIKKKFQNNHYATRALGLLKTLLKDNDFDQHKSLYISTLKDNIASQKVAKNNGGELYYEGNVPKDNSLNYIDGVEEVRIYRIKL